MSLRSGELRRGQRPLHSFSCLDNDQGRNRRPEIWPSANRTTRPSFKLRLTRRLTLHQGAVDKDVLQDGFHSRNFRLQFSNVQLVSCTALNPP